MVKPNKTGENESESMNAGGANLEKKKCTKQPQNTGAPKTAAVSFQFWPAACKDGLTLPMSFLISWAM